MSKTPTRGSSSRTAKSPARKAKTPPTKATEKQSAEKKRSVAVSADSETEPKSSLLSFTDLGLMPELLRAVEDSGYTNPTPIQQQAIPLALKGRDLIGLAQTGTGKTAGFTLPIIQRLLEEGYGHVAASAHRVRVLVLTPTRELCVQVEESFRKYGKHTTLRVAPIYGGVGVEPQTKLLRNGVDVIVATPGRLLDHMERQNVVFDDLEVLVLDEAPAIVNGAIADFLRA